jgi:feruloyl esterase
MSDKLFKCSRAGGLLAAAALLLCGSPSMAAPPSPCSVSAIQALAPKGTTIKSADPTATPVPHCKIDGSIITNNPGPNTVNFRLQLPDTGWTGRYYFIGMGGAAGYVPSDSQIPAGNPLVKGFAVAGTDTGHQGDMLNWGFLVDPAKAEDHIDRGAHVTAVATQKITKGYYKATALHRYFSGCSGGGRMATMSIERHPEDFDGVLLGAPGGRSDATMLAFIYNAQQANREPGAWVSPAKLQMLDRKVTAQCDALDGAKDGIIWDHTACQVDFKQFKCPASDGPECLTGAELKTVEAIVGGPIGPDGKPIKPGYPVSNISVWATFLGPTPPPWSDDTSMANMQKASSGYVIASSLAKVFFGPHYDVLKEFNFNDQKQLDAWWQATDRIGFGAPYSANLQGLSKSGGKVIMWNGVSDPCCIDTELRGYYRDAAKSVGGVERLDKFAKLYFLPGTSHCGGGTGPEDAPDQLLEAMINWVEKAQPPAAVVAHRGDRARKLFADPKTGTVSGVLVPTAAGSPRDFLLCPFPQVAKFNSALADKEGAVNDAANWSCQTPAS